MTNISISLAGLTAVFAIALYLIYNSFVKHKNIPVEGYFDPKFRKVAERFREQLIRGSTRGSTLSVYYKGKRVVNLWGGYADPEFEIPWRSYSLANVASLSKGVCAIAVALLVHRGKLNYSECISKYWPEFGSNGKENITVEMLMSHQSGLIGLEPKIPLALLKKWSENVGEIDGYLVQQKPQWIPGSRIGYNMAAYGLYVDALIRHVDDRNRTAAEFFHDEIAIPHDIDFYIGLPKELFYRKVRDEDSGIKWQWYIDALKSRRYFTLGLNTFINPNLEKAYKILTEKKEISTNDPEVASIPWLSGIGFGTSDSLAKLFSYLIDTEQTLLTNDIIEQLCQPIGSGIDAVVNIEATYSRGLFIMKNILGEDVCGHTGYGGQLVFVDRHREVSVCYITNDNTIYFFGGDPKVGELEAAIYQCIDDL